jgi:hypothetical protein
LEDDDGMGEQERFYDKFILAQIMCWIMLHPVEMMVEKWRLALLTALKYLLI